MSKTPAYFKRMRLRPQDNDCGAGTQAADRPVAARAGGRDPGGYRPASSFMSGSYIEIFRQLRPASLQAREGADDGSRWRGPDRPPWFSCREKEWVRRLGASPPMRMSASWFGSWTHRIQGRGAIDPRPESGLPSDRHP